ncbi:MAG TPA: 3-hydroxyacyl-CoA dehydrogenase NAD-binding domain-containing protein [Acidisarcina sp.]|nr:3-hydroxyacyl-CoA dehydrogenase NAD-binding domain-containing protein [Acidisarcina sp.]
MSSMVSGDVQPVSRELSAELSAKLPAKLPLIRRAAVLGAGTMGSRIAAHLANAGVPVLLLDIVPAGEQANRSRIAVQAIEALLKAKPAAFYEASLAQLVTPGNFEDDLPQLAGCDWVIEAVTEDLTIKQSLLGKILPHLAPLAILTTNTSGLPIASIAAGLPEEFRNRGYHRRWFGTHFFNPPRYMRLVEIIPTPESDPEVVADIARFVDQRLGKTVVYSHDTPNFVANRIGVFTLFTSIRLMMQQGLSIEEVDALTGSAIGWPRTGTFRLADMVGIDVLAHVAANFARSGGSDGSSADLPAFLKTMLERHWLGDKAGQGFYKKEKDAEGKELRLALDVNTVEYRPLAKAKLAALDMAKNAESLGARLKMLLAAEPRKDKAAAFLWPLLARLWNYAADRVPEIADDIPSIDRAMHAGFNWELGPFEMWDAAGVAETVEHMRAMNEPICPNVEKLLAAGHSSWYKDDASQASGRVCFNPVSGEYEPVILPEGIATVAMFRKAHGVVRKNAGASLVDLGDGIGCIELHSLKNAIGDDIVHLVTQVLHRDSEPVQQFRGFVISGDAENFSVGANLMQLLLAAQEGEWEDLDLAVRAFQRMTASIKFCPRPVVVAPFGLCLGGGTEIALHAARRQPHAELYMGLVEAGVGLVPGGGGTKEMALRAIDAAAAIAKPAPNDPPAKFAMSGEMLDALKKSLEIVAMAKVSTSALEARTLGLLAPCDRITLHRNRILLDAKQTALTLAEAGYSAPVERARIPVAGEAVLPTLKLGIHMMRQAEYISDHDLKVASKVAHILCGGTLTPGSLVSEQYFLDLEREAFLSLCGERKTQERIAFTLKTGKPLRN